MQGRKMNSRSYMQSGGAGLITLDEERDVGHPHTEYDSSDNFVFVPYGDAGSLNEHHFGSVVVK